MGITAKIKNIFTLVNPNLALTSYFKFKYPYKTNSFRYLFEIFVKKRIKMLFKNLEQVYTKHYQ